MARGGCKRCSVPAAAWSCWMRGSKLVPHAVAAVGEGTPLLLLVLRCTRPTRHSRGMQPPAARQVAAG